MFLDISEVVSFFSNKKKVWITDQLDKKNFIKCNNHATIKQKVYNVTSVIYIYI